MKRQPHPRYLMVVHTSLFLPSCQVLNAELHQVAKLAGDSGRVHSLWKLFNGTLFLRLGPAPQLLRKRLVTLEDVRSIRCAQYSCFMLALCRITLRIVAIRILPAALSQQTIALPQKVPSGVPHEPLVVGETKVLAKHSQTLNSFCP